MAQKLDRLIVDLFDLRRREKEYILFGGSAALAALKDAVSRFKADLNGDEELEQLTARYVASLFELVERT